MKNLESMSVRRSVYDKVLKFFLYVCAIITCMLLVGIIGYIFCRGIGHITWKFLSTAPSALKDTIGILPNILNTLYIILVSIFIVLPIGIGAAVYLNEYAANKKLVAVIEFATETLAGIPSILYGLVGMMFFVQFCNLQTSLMAGSLTLAIMILPTIIRTTQESLKTVPNSYREGGLALGAGKWHMIHTIILPCSIDGIVTGCILAIGRIVGESAALLFTAGIGSVIVCNIFDAMSHSGGTLSVALYVYVFERGKFDIGFAIAVILMILTIIINFTAKLVNKKLKNKY